MESAQVGEGVEALMFDKHQTPGYDPPLAHKQGHLIGIAALRAGLTPPVIRVWEKRGGVTPHTLTSTYRRLSSKTVISSARNCYIVPRSRAEASVKSATC